MKIHVLGASCAGATTFGNALSEALGIPYFDTDAFFWEQSAIPYTVKRDPVLRSQMLREALARLDHYIVGGSLVSWGTEWQLAFDLAVFLYVPAEIRMQRLVQRELQRYGDIIYTDSVRNQQFKDFYAWASRYDDRTFMGRSVRVHEEWLAQLTCKVIGIRGDTTVTERLELVLAGIDK